MISWICEERREKLDDFTAERVRSDYVYGGGTKSGLGVVEWVQGGDAA